MEGKSENLTEGCGEGAADEGGYHGGGGRKEKVGLGNGNWVLRRSRGKMNGPKVWVGTWVILGTIQPN